MDKGYVEGVDQKLIDLLPEKMRAKASSEAAATTVRHALTMKDGIARDLINDSISEYTLSKPLRAEPGTSFFYSNLSPMLISMAITQATGMTAWKFARGNLCGPLGIRNAPWPETGGYSRGGYGLLMSTRDIAKIGYLFLNGGLWEDRQIISREWISESTREQTETGAPSESSKRYGYFWRIHSPGGYPGFIARGAFGQSLSVIPGLDLVVVINISDTTDSMGEKYYAIVDNCVLPEVAVEDLRPVHHHAGPQHVAVVGDAVHGEMTEHAGLHLPSVGDVHAMLAPRHAPPQGRCRSGSPR